MLSAYDAYGSAQKVRTLVQRDFDAARQGADVLVSPTAPVTATASGAATVGDVQGPDVTAIPANLAGVPGTACPGLSDDGLPVGFQIPRCRSEPTTGSTVPGAGAREAAGETWGRRRCLARPSWRRHDE